VARCVELPGISWFFALWPGLGAVAAISRAENHVNMMNYDITS
jgi:hypothetical protein